MEDKVGRECGTTYIQGAVGESRKKRAALKT
jgi:hypothetical protein